MEEEVLMSPSSGRRPSSQFRLRRAPTASQEYRMQSAGLEPGLDPNSDPFGHDEKSTLHTECQITVVEFSEDQIEKHDFYNDGLKEFLEKPRADWVKVGAAPPPGPDWLADKSRCAGSTVMDCRGMWFSSWRNIITSIRLVWPGWLLPSLVFWLIGRSIGGFVVAA
jgi:hypothetical protein